MVNYRKIDSFFNGEKPLVSHGDVGVSRRVKLLRFVKLVLPSAAAVLIGCILIWPSLKENAVISGLDETLPQKGELEKLHMEQTVFSVTNENNEISTLTADTIDETEAGSQVMKLVNPKGEIPAQENKMVYADAKTGYYDQNNSTFKAVDNVKAVYDQDTTVLTQEAVYDFKKSFGEGHEKVYAYGSWGKLWADGFLYDKNQNLITLLGSSKIESGKRTLWADKEVRYYQNENRVEAEGNVKLFESPNTLYADKMIAYLKDGSTQELEKAESFGNVRIDTPDGTAMGDYGLYLPQKDDMELHGHVRIMQKGNIIQGDRAVTNLKTSVSRVLKSEKTNQRVSGVIRGQTIKGQNHEK